MSTNKVKSVEEFDRRFDEGESIFELAEVKSVSRPNLEPQRINVDVPKYFLKQLDRAAALRGISRQALIKTWLYERLESQSLNIGRESETADTGYLAPALKKALRKSLNIERVSETAGNLAAEIEKLLLSQVKGKFPRGGRTRIRSVDVPVRQKRDVSGT